MSSQILRNIGKQSSREHMLDWVKSFADNLKAKQALALGLK